MALHIDKWVEYMTDKFITIENISSMKKNDKETFLALDRNMYDLCSDNFNKGEFIASNFFKENYILDYIHNNDLSGIGKWQTIDKNYSLFNFDINYEDHDWYPLDKNGYLPNKDPQGFFNLTSIKKYWKDYPKNTLVGWRGQMIKWSDVSDSPKIYYN